MKYTMTPEDAVKLEEIKQKYIKNALRTDAMTEHDKDMMRIAMRGLYKNANLPYPGDDKIIFVASPLIAQFAAGIAMSYIHGNKAEQAARQAAGQAEQAARQAAGQAARQAAGQAEQAAGQAARQAEQAAGQAARQAAGQAEQAAEQAEQAAEQAARQAARQAAGQAADQAEQAEQAEQAAEQAAGQAGQAEQEKETSLNLYLNSFISLGNKKGKHALFSISFSWYYRTRSAMWPWYQVFGDFFKNVAKIPGEWDKWEPLNLDCLHGGTRFMTPQFTIISDRPEVLKLDDNGRLHAENGPAVKWRDGMKQYYWHGVSVPDYWIKNKELLLPEDALKIVNMDQRKAACEILGWNNILKKLKSKVIDKNKDPQIGVLIECDIPGVGKEKFLRVTCGTGREFSLIVPPTMKTAIEANAWTYALDATEYRPEIRT